MSDKLECELTLAHIKIDDLIKEIDELREEVAYFKDKADEFGERAKFFKGLATQQSRATDSFIQLFYSIDGSYFTTSESEFNVAREAIVTIEEEMGK